MLNEKSLDISHLSIEVTQLKIALQIVFIIFGFSIFGFAMYKMIKSRKMLAFFMRFASREGGVYPMSHFNESSTSVTMLDNQDQIDNENSSTQVVINENEGNTNSQVIEDGEFTTPRRDPPADALNVSIKSGN